MWGQVLLLSKPTSRVTDRYTREAMERETIRTAERAALALG